MALKQAFNPYLPSYEYVPDGEPRIFGDRLYLYGSHDAFNGTDFCVNDYVCWSAPLDNLADWRYEGVLYRAVQDPKNRRGHMHMNAPDVVQGPDGRYYLYYQLHALACTCVAVCDTSAGHYEYYGCVEKNGKPLGNSKGDPYAFDPGVLVDANGRIWLYVGFAAISKVMRFLIGLRGSVADGAYCVELAPDMKTVIGQPKRVLPGPEAAAGTSFAGHAFYEASSPRRIGESYYLVYSSQLSHELCYAVGKNPDGPYIFGGTLVSIGDVGYQGRVQPINYTGNTHGGMVQVNGQWYIFYHRQTNRQKCARQGCAEKLTILPDGSIPQVEVTSCGLNPGPLAGHGTYEARIACNLWSREGTFAYRATHEKDEKGIHPYFTQSGTDRETDGDQYIAGMTEGATAGFKYFALHRLCRIGVQVRTDAPGRLEVRLSPEQPPVACIDVRPCIQWSDFCGTLAAPETGTHALYFTYSGSGKLDFYSFTLYDGDDADYAASAKQ